MLRNRSILRDPKTVKTYLKSVRSRQPMGVLVLGPGYTEYALHGSVW